MPTLILQAVPMRIVLFTDAYHPQVSGLVSSIDEFCRCLTERGHQVRIVCPSYPSYSAEADDRFPCIRVPSMSAFVASNDRLAIPWRESEALREVDAFDPEVVHIQTEFSIGFLGKWYCRTRGKPVLATCHTHYEMYAKGYFPWAPEALCRLVARTGMRMAYRRVDHIVTPSLHIRDVMRSYGLDRNFVVIPTGVDARLFRPRPEEAAVYRKDLARRYPGFGKGPLLLYAGRIGQEKNLSLLAAAMSTLVARFPELRLLMVGDGPRKTELHQEFRRYGLQDQVLWTGFQPRELLPVIYSAADIFVFPSTTETQGLVTIEAMLCGTPVVGVDKMGSAEILAGDRGGFLTSDDPDAFAAAVARLLEDPVLRAAKAEEARIHARRWTIDNACDLMERLYSNVFGTRDGEPEEASK